MTIRINATGLLDLSVLDDHIIAIAGTKVTISSHGTLNNYDSTLFSLSGTNRQVLFLNKISLNRLNLSCRRSNPLKGIGPAKV